MRGCKALLNFPLNAHIYSAIKAAKAKEATDGTTTNSTNSSKTRSSKTQYTPRSTAALMESTSMTSAEKAIEALKSKALFKSAAFPIEHTTNYFPHLDQIEPSSNSSTIEPTEAAAAADERLARTLAQTLARTMCTTTASPESEFRAAMLKRAAELSQLSTYMQQLAGGGADLAASATPEVPRTFSFQEQAALFNAVEQSVPVAGIPTAATSASASGLRRSRSLLSFDDLNCWEPSQKRISRRTAGGTTSWGSTCSL